MTPPVSPPALDFVAASAAAAPMAGQAGGSVGRSGREEEGAPPPASRASLPASPALSRSVMDHHFFNPSLFLFQFDEVVTHTQRGNLRRVGQPERGRARALHEACCSQATPRILKLTCSKACSPQCAPSTEQSSSSALGLADCSQGGMQGFWRYKSSTVEQEQPRSRHVGETEQTETGLRYGAVRCPTRSCMASRSSVRWLLHEAKEVSGGGSADAHVAPRHARHVLALSQSVLSHQSGETRHFPANVDRFCSAHSACHLKNSLPARMRLRYRGASLIRKCPP